MKVIAILICSFLFISSIHAQNIQPKQDLKRLSYGISFAPEINYRVLRSRDSGENWLKKERDGQETSKFGFSAGLVFEYRLNDHFRITTGITYNDRGFKTKSQELSWIDSNSDDLSVQGFISHHYKYVDIPINLQYNYGISNRTAFIVTGGITPAVFTEKSTVLHTNTKGKEFTHADNQFIGYDRFNLYGNAGIGAELYLTNNIKIRGLFLYKQALRSTNTRLDLGEYLHSFGIDFAILWTPFVKKDMD